MVLSMTGYGKAAGTCKERQMTVEIKTLNAKQLDVLLKMPSAYNEFEPGIRLLLSQALERGKVFCAITSETTGDEAAMAFNMPLARRYFDQMREMEQQLGLDATADYLSLLMKMPDVIRTAQAEPDPEEYTVLEQAVRDAVAGVNAFRAQEGKALSEDIGARIRMISELLGKVDPFEGNRIAKIRERMQRELAEGVGTGFDPNRFEQELIYYIEKLDITEEKVRLKNHLDHFLQVMEGEGANGRKLGFIAQEIGREVNTLGSKAGDSDLQKIVVEMKDELEKIKEQLLNIL